MKGNRSRPEDQPEEDRSHKAESTTSRTSQSDRGDLPTKEGVHIPDSIVRHDGRWQRHQESPQQGQKRLQNDEQCLEVIPVQPMA